MMLNNEIKKNISLSEINGGKYWSRFDDDIHEYLPECKICLTKVRTNPLLLIQPMS